MVDTLFAPWRLEYVTSADARSRAECVFCHAFASGDDRSTHTLWRGDRSFALLNRYPYTSGHCMVAPIEHCGDLESLDDTTIMEILQGARTAMSALRRIYNPHGFNVGFNVGEAAGAGIEEHLHLHIVPRWRADTNFMGVLGNARVIPEDLDRTFDRIRGVIKGVVS